MPDLLPWVIFLASAGVVAGAGSKLAGAGDRIAKETGIGGLWIGVVLIAAATSLPEIMSTSTAAGLHETDLAAGGIFGSSMSNMLILALLGVSHRRRRFWLSVSQGHALVAALAIVLTSLAGLFILSDVSGSVARVGAGTIVIAVFYILGMRVVYRQEYFRAHERFAAAREGAAAEEAREEAGLRPPSRRAALTLLVSAAFVVAAAPFVASSAADISGRSGSAIPSRA